MKNTFKVSLLTILLLTLSVVLAGCKGFFDQPGMTAQEVHREHLRMIRVNQQQLMRDLDRAGHFDRPSQLSELRVNPYP